MAGVRNRHLAARRIMKDVDFPSQAHALKDAALYLYSDGIIEAGQQHGQTWGIQGLSDFLDSQRNHSLSTSLDAVLTETLSRHSDGMIQDDVSVLAFELK